MHQLAKTPPGNADNGSFTTLWTGLRVQTIRYLALLRRRWWLVALTISLGLCAAAWYISQQPPAYLSVGRLMVSGQINFNEGAQYAESTFDFFGTQIELMQSGEVRQRAHERVSALYPDLPYEDVKLQVGQVPHATIFMMRCIGKSPKYTQAYLDACMDEYVATKRQMRSQKSDSTQVAIADELVQLEQELQKDEEDMHNFQKENNIGYLQENGNSAGAYLSKLNEELANLQKSYDLDGMLDLDENVQRINGAASGVDPKSSPTEGNLNMGTINEYLKAKRDLADLQSQYSALGQNLRPRHPSMVALSEKISNTEATLESLKEQSREIIREHREATKIQIDNNKEVIKQWEAKALDLSRRIADFDKLKSKSDRTRQQYERLTMSLHSVDVTKRVDQDMISILEKASPATSTRPGFEIILAAGFAAGALLGLAILFVLDKLDDRIGSFIEFRSHFTENLLGQIPREGKEGTLALLAPNDARHSLLESFRTLRSSLIFLPVEGHRPKTLLVTSATPREGKTTISANLAISLAFSGAKTLLVDADLRRGRVAELFGVESGGFSKVLQQRLPWQEAVVPTAIPNLSVLPRGKSLTHPGEHLLGKVTDQFLRDVYDHYDYIIFDSAPVMAADDTLSLAPKIDGTIFVVRFSTSSARTSRKAVELLEQRTINLLGLVVNDVKLSESDYGYGYYYEYHSPQPEPPTLGVGVG